MVKTYFYELIESLHALESKIAFYPTVISLFGICFAFLMFLFESYGVSEYLLEHAPILVVNNIDTARNLLSTFIAGLISIMVFSFSLVMILLNQASSNFSPRLLPGLISNKRHQIVLGIYNGTLLYCIFTLVSIEPSDGKYQVPGFSVLLTIVFTTLSLGAFIYFIHSISQEIQVNVIMKKIFEESKSRLTKIIKDEKGENVEFENTSDWKNLRATTTGYMQQVELEILADLSEENDLKIEIVPIKGSFILEGITILKYKGEVNDELKESLLRTIKFSNNEFVENNYVLAFRQLTEIAVKAMSPGINDPGTCISAINYLTELFALQMRKHDESYFLNDDGEPLIRINTVNFDELLYNVMASLRVYCKHDIIIVQKLFTMLKYLLQTDKGLQDKHRDVIQNEIENLNADAKENHKNKADLEIIKQNLETLENL